MKHVTDENLMSYRYTGLGVQNDVTMLQVYRMKRQLMYVSSRGRPPHVHCRCRCDERYVLYMLNWTRLPLTVNVFVCVRPSGL